MIHQSRPARADINPTVNFLQILLLANVQASHNIAISILAFNSVNRVHASDEAEELLNLDPDVYDVYSGQFRLTAVIMTAIYQEEHDSPR